MSRDPRGHDRGVRRAAEDNAVRALRQQQSVHCVYPRCPHPSRGWHDPRDGVRPRQVCRLRTHARPHCAPAGRLPPHTGLRQARASNRRGHEALVPPPARSHLRAAASRRFHHGIRQPRRTRSLPHLVVRPSHQPLGRCRHQPRREQQAQRPHQLMCVSGRAHAILCWDAPEAVQEGRTRPPRRLSQRPWPERGTRRALFPTHALHQQLQRAAHVRASQVPLPRRGAQLPGPTAANPPADYEPRHHRCAAQRASHAGQAAVHLPLPPPRRRRGAREAHHRPAQELPAGGGVRGSPIRPGVRAAVRRLRAAPCAGHDASTREDQRCVRGAVRCCDGAHDGVVYVRSRNLRCRGPRRRGDERRLHQRLRGEDVVPAAPHTLARPRRASPRRAHGPA
eukprot:PhM_4_TR5471/c0_g1_i1/m.17964